MRLVWGTPNCVAWDAFERQHNMLEDVVAVEYFLRRPSQNVHAFTLLVIRLILTSEDARK